MTHTAMPYSLVKSDILPFRCTLVAQRIAADFRCPIEQSCVPAETALSRLEAKNLLTNYRINAMGPILVSKVNLSNSCL